MYLETETMEKYCVGCGEKIHPKRIEIMPNTNTCVRCSEVGRKRGVSIQVGEGDHSFTEVVILEEKDYIQYTISEQKMRKKSLGKSKAEFLNFEIEDKFEDVKFDDSEE